MTRIHDHPYMVAMGPTPADVAQLLQEWEAAIATATEAVNAEYRQRLTTLSGSSSVEPVQQLPASAMASVDLHLPSRGTRNRRVLDVIVAKSATQAWVAVRELAEAIAPLESVDVDGEDWQSFVQRTRNSLSALKKTGHLVDRGGGTGEWKLTDAALAALSSSGDTA